MSVPCVWRAGEHYYWRDPSTKASLVQRLLA
jgi:hypothetical protein